MRPVRIRLRELCHDDGIAGADAGATESRKVAETELHHQASDLAAAHRRVVAPKLPAFFNAKRVEVAVRPAGQRRAVEKVERLAWRAKSSSHADLYTFHEWICREIDGGADETRTRDLLRDRQKVSINASARPLTFIPPLSLFVIDSCTHIR